MTGLCYEIEHVSRYSYTSPVRNCVMALCLEPRNDLGQRLLRFDITTDPLVPLNGEMDYFGNTKHVLNVHREHEALEVTGRSMVELTPAAPLPGSLSDDAWEEIRSWRESFRDWDFTHASDFTRPSPALASFVDRHGIAGPSGDPLQALVELSDTLHRSFEYAPGSTSVISPIDHILESGRGVCQDYAHVMIAVARSWGVPTRYVSGYFHVAGPAGGQALGNGDSRLGRMPAARSGVGRVRPDQSESRRRAARAVSGRPRPTATWRQRAVSFRAWRKRSSRSISG